MLLVESCDHLALMVVSAGLAHARIWQVRWLLLPWQGSTGSTDRALDLATLLFYLYDHDDIRDLPRARLLELAGSQAARAYLAHMVLRQVDWSLRHHPAAAITRRHLGLARLVMSDITDGGPLS